MKKSRGESGGEACVKEKHREKRDKQREREDEHD
jgi:hypothetical protein